MENNIENKKQPYYIFMDIDGSMWDKAYGEYVHGPFLSGIDSPALKRSSIEAINVLTDTLEKHFDTKLVITSRRREYFQNCLMYLKRYGLKYDKPIFCTDFKPGDRGQKIVDFMQEKGEHNFSYPRLKNIFERIMYERKDNKDFKNYVVIDDTKSIIKKQIPPSRTILTNGKKESLTMQQVVDYLLANNIPVHIPGEQAKYL